MLCPVRDCRQRLTGEPGRLICPSGHSFDIARSGYVNLLQPQDSRSRHPGDSSVAVAARRRLHERGVTAPLLQGISTILQAGPQDSVLDAGCGDGYYLGSIAGQSNCAGCGVDISRPAVEAAARKYPACGWIAANADRFIPWADASFSAVISITARMNAPEFRRVLRRSGRLLVAVPAPDDLMELRGKGRDRVPRTLESFSVDFDLLETGRVTTTADLDAAAVEDVLHSIYRPLQPAAATAMHLTFSLDLLLFRVIASP